MVKKKVVKGKKAVAKKPVKKVVKAKASAKKRVAVKSKVPAKKAKVTSKVKTKRKPNPQFMVPLAPSSALAEIVGSKALPRTEAVKKVWAYIKKNGLQDKRNKREINADSKLKTLFRKDKVTMFDLAKIISKNLSK